MLTRGEVECINKKKITCSDGDVFSLIILIIIIIWVGPLATPIFDFSFMFLALGIFTTEGEKNNNKLIYEAP